MQSARSAKVSLTIDVNGSGNTVTFESDTGACLTIYGDLGTQNLGRERERLETALETFRSLCSQSETPFDWRKVTSAMQLLHERGRRLSFHLFGNSSDIRKVEQFFKKHVPPLRAGGLAPLIEVIADERASIPIEVIPVFNFEESQQITDLRQLENAAQAFPGFTCVVKRTVRQKGEKSRRRESFVRRRSQTLYVNPKLPMKFFYNAKLDNAKMEWAFLNSTPKLDVDGPWPTTQEKAFATEISRHMWHRDLRFDGQPHDYPAEIYHFACHCNTNGDDSDRYFLELSSGSGPAQRVTIGELQDAFLKLSPRAKSAPERDLPLVFLNACGGSKITAASVSSFPRFLIAEGFRGVIGTETKIPDSAAFEFARAFYECFLNGNPLGEALLRARLKLLSRANPIGILYTLYADPDTVIGVHKGG